MTDTNKDICVDIDSNASTGVATVAKEVSEKKEDDFIPGELKWTSNKVSEESTVSQPVVAEDNEQQVAVEETKTDLVGTSPQGNQKWIWAGVLFGIFFISFFVGYTVLGNRYWREVFDIHTWVHTLKFLVG